MRLTTIGTLAGALILCASIASAQTPPDVVELVNGGMIRGTIVERMPGDYVVIRDTAGQHRRFAQAEVRYAGADRSTGRPAAPPTVHPGSTVMDLRIRVTSEEPNLGLAVHAGSNTYRNGDTLTVVHTYRDICLAPCATRIARGNYRLAVNEGGKYRGVRGSFTLTEDTDIRLSLVKPTIGRIVGAALFGIGLAGGLPLMLNSVSPGFGEPASVGGIVGASLLLAASFAGLFTLIFLRNRGHVEVSRPILVRDRAPARW